MGRSIKCKCGAKYKNIPEDETRNCISCGRVLRDRDEDVEIDEPKKRRPACVLCEEEGKWERYHFFAGRYRYSVSTYDKSLPASEQYDRRGTSSTYSHMRKVTTFLCEGCKSTLWMKRYLVYAAVWMILAVFFAIGAALLTQVQHPGPRSGIIPLLGIAGLLFLVSLVYAFWALVPSYDQTAMEEICIGLRRCELKGDADSFFTTRSLLTHAQSLPEDLM